LLSGVLVGHKFALNAKSFIESVQREVNRHHERANFARDVVDWQPQLDVESVLAPSFANWRADREQSRRLIF
jgi:hypothetical protein